MVELGNKLVKDFASITNDTVKKSVEAVLYGVVKILDGDTYVQIDGSSAFTPATTTVKVGDGHRVIISLKDHKATITGNLSDPSAFGIILDDVNKTITMRGYVTIESLQEGGTTTIDGSRITTGTIKAERLDLTGAISFSDLNTETQNKINNAAPKSQFSVTGISNWHDTMTDEDKFRRDSTDGGATWGPAYQFRGTDGAPGQNGEDGSDANVPNYIKSTYIDGESVSSPVLRGGIIAGATFTDLNQASALVLNPSSGYANVADLILYGGGDGDDKAFTIYDEIGSILISGYGVSSLRISAVTQATSALGTWNFYGDVDFTSANVVGLEGAGTGDGYAKFK